MMERVEQLANQIENIFDKHKPIPKPVLGDSQEVWLEKILQLLIYLDNKAFPMFKKEELDEI